MRIQEEECFFSDELVPERPPRRRLPFFDFHFFLSFEALEAAGFCAFWRGRGGRVIVFSCKLVPVRLDMAEVYNALINLRKC